jgi:hypothetical protein
MNFEYDVAFSFAGEDRELARVIASIAQANELRVFIDEQHYWESWGRNLNEYLGAIYDGKTKHCVILVSKAYCEKSYTNLERRRALDHALESRTEYILPILLDDSWPEGLPRSTSFLDSRRLSATAIGQALVLKVKGPDTIVTVPPGIAEPKVVAAGAVDTSAGARNSGLEFVDIRIAPECNVWKLKESANSEGGLQFKGGFGDYEDPIFDIVVINRSAEPLLLLAVGIEVVAASCKSWVILGGRSAEPLDLHRTYQLDLPDVWLALARSVKQGKPVSETSSCRLPDPILFEARRPYRFGLQLFEYTDCCPPEVDLYFTARTDRGEARSLTASLRYTLGSDIPSAKRYKRFLDPALAEQDAQAALRFERETPYKWLVKHSNIEGELQAAAHQFWEQAGKPEGRDLEFWTAAEREVASRLLEENYLYGAYKRPLLDGERPRAAFHRVVT